MPTSCFLDPVRGNNKLSFCLTLDIPGQLPLQMRTSVGKGMTRLRAVRHGAPPAHQQGLPEGHGIHSHLKHGKPLKDSGQLT